MMRTVCWIVYEKFANSRRENLQLWCPYKRNPQIHKVQMGFAWTFVCHTIWASSNFSSLLHRSKCPKNSPCQQAYVGLDSSCHCHNCKIYHHYLASPQNMLAAACLIDGTQVLEIPQWTSELKNVHLLPVISGLLISQFCQSNVKLSLALWSPVSVWGVENKQCNTSDVNPCNTNHVHVRSLS